MSKLKAATITIVIIILFFLLFCICKIIHDFVYLNYGSNGTSMLVLIPTLILAIYLIFISLINKK